MVRAMSENVELVIKAMKNIVEGGEISFEAVQSLTWQASETLDPFMQRIYRELQMFASDLDLRSKDADYDASWRSGIAELLKELQQKLRGSKE
jgi:hypothetical protein